jgi:hypothetical protein
MRRHQLGEQSKYIFAKARINEIGQNDEALCLFARGNPSVFLNWLKFYLALFISCNTENMKLSKISLLGALALAFSSLVAPVQATVTYPTERAYFPDRKSVV